MVNLCRDLRAGGGQLPLADIAASFQAAVVEVLVEKAARAMRALGAQSLAVAGGVAANGCLRRALRDRAGQEGWDLTLPPRELCTDNGAMVAAAGYFLYRLGKVADQYLEAVPGLSLPAFLGN